MLICKYSSTCGLTTGDHALPHTKSQCLNEGRTEIVGASPPDLLGVVRAPQDFVTSAKRRFVSEFRAENLCFWRQLAG